jgi:heme O synthase-like polyprenyltransferase
MTILAIPGILSFAFFCCSAPLALRKSKRAARRTLMASILYLPLIFIVILLGKR